MPPLLELENIEAYRQHYIQTLCRRNIKTYDGIPVFFHPRTFGHAFFENSSRRKLKDTFSIARSKRMDWISEALSDPEATCVHGWFQKQQFKSPKRRVTLFHDFVIVLDVRLKKNGEPKAHFITCYNTRKNTARIHRSPIWTMEAFLNDAKKSGR